MIGKGSRASHIGERNKRWLSFNMGLFHSDIGNVLQLLRPDDTCKGIFWSGADHGSTAIFVFGGGDGFCRPVALAPALAELALPLPSCFPTSSTAIFMFGNGDARPAAAISISRGSSITKRPGWRMRPAMRPASSPAPQ